MTFLLGGVHVNGWVEISGMTTQTYTLTRTYTTSTGFCCGRLLGRDVGRDRVRSGGWTADASRPVVPVQGWLRFLPLVDGTARKPDSSPRCMKKRPASVPFSARAAQPRPLI